MSVPRARAHLQAFVALVALHSVGVGTMLIGAPAWVVDFGGFATAGDPFFLRQAGAFHFVVALGYWGELRSYGGVRLLIATKAIAFAFLLGAWLDGEPAWVVPLSGLADGAMGLIAWWLHRRARLAAA